MSSIKESPKPELRLINNPNISFLLAKLKLARDIRNTPPTQAGSTL